MTWFATLHSVSDRQWQQRLVVLGTLDVYLQNHVEHRALPRETEVRRYVWLLGDQLLRTWNSMSRASDQDGVTYMVHFEIRARAGSSRRIQDRVDAMDPTRPEVSRSIAAEIHQQAELAYTNVAAVFPRAADDRLGKVPPVSTAHRALPPFQHQPWSSLMLLGPNASRYTMAHEVGHLLGLGEGYRLFVTQTIRSGGVELPAAHEERTIPSEAGTPMARSGEAGRDANEGQLDAIVGYARAALQAGNGGTHYGPAVDHYRARRDPAQ